MAEPLYNKYRPLTLNDVWGQKKIVESLKTRVKEDSIPRTILLTGLTGTGKSTLEKIISKSILCKNKDENGSPCNKCSECLTVMSEKISNFYYLNNASNLGIDEMRQLEEIANIRELGIKHKVIVIDEFQEISSNQKASKNILKILEKQSTYATFILCAMDDSKINKAIKDRCVTYNLQKLSIEDISSNLYSICQKENVNIDTEEKANILLTIAESVEGSMRGALSYLERVLDSDIWSIDELKRELNIISNKDIVEAINYLLTGNIQVLETKFTKEIIDRLRYTLNLVFKKLSNVELNQYERTQLAGISKNITIENCIIAYEELNKLFTYAWTPNDLIEYTLIRIVQRIQENKTMFASGGNIKKEEVKSDTNERRRR